MKIYENVVIGKPLVEASELIASDLDDWNNNEKVKTLFTNARYLPAVMVMAGVAPTISEVRRNRKDLNIVLNDIDCLWVKWGKRFLYIIVGE